MQTMTKQGWLSISQAVAIVTLAATWLLLHDYAVAAAITSGIVLVGGFVAYRRSRSRTWVWIAAVSAVFLVMALWGTWTHPAHRTDTIVDQRS